MTELDQFDVSINTELDKLQREIEALSKKESVHKKNALKKCQNMIKSINTLIESYELEVTGLDRIEA